MDGIVWVVRADRLAVVECFDHALGMSAPTLVGIVQELLVGGAVGRAAEVDGGLGVSRVQRAGKRHQPRGVIQDELNGRTQLFAVLLGQFERAKGMRIGVAGAACNKERGSAGIIGLDTVLA